MAQSNSEMQVSLKGSLNFNGNISMKSKCKRHPNHFSNIFCKTCEELICPYCLPLFHKNHDLHGLEDVCKEYVKDLRDLEPKIDEVVECFDHENDYLDELEKIHSMKYEEGHRKIKAQEEFFISKVKEQTRKMIFELDRNWDIISSDITFQRQRIDDIKRDLEVEKMDITKSIKSKDIERMVNDKRRILNSIHKIETQEIEHIQQSRDFHSGIFDEESLSKMIGTLKETFIPDPNPKYKNIDFNSLFDYEFNDSDICDIQKIVRCGENVFWLKTPMDFVQISLDEDNMAKLRKIQLSRTEDMTVSNSGKIFFTLKNGSKIFQFTNEEQVKTFIDMSPQIPIALSATTENGLLVSMVDKNIGKMEESQIIPKCQVVNITEEKKQLQLFKVDEGDKNQVFDFPSRIAVNINEDICIILLSTNHILSGKVVTLDKNGTQKWEYNGDATISRNIKQFLPSDIAITRIGNIIVCDTLHNTFHIINIHGQSLMIKDSTVLNICRPLSMAITSTGNLLVGCCSRSPGIKKTTLHARRIKGF